MPTSQSNIPPSGKTDVMFQEIKVYIEGVQIPFIAASISSGIGMLPYCISKCSNTNWNDGNNEIL
jgi:hypothetical protein